MYELSKKAYIYITCAMDIFEINTLSRRISILCSGLTECEQNNFWLYAVTLRQCMK